LLYAKLPAKRNSSFGILSGKLRYMPVQAESAKPWDIWGCSVTDETRKFRGKSMVRTRRRWTDADKQFLRDNYQKRTNRGLAKHFGLTPAGIGYHLKKLGLKRDRWTEEQDDFLRSRYLEMSNQELANELGKSVHAVEKRLGTIKLRRHKKWTAEREGFLRDNYEIMSNAFLAGKLEITELAVAKKLSRLGLIRKSKRKWSKKKEEFLSEL